MSGSGWVSLSECDLFGCVSLSLVVSCVAVCVTMSVCVCLCLSLSLSVHVFLSAWVCVVVFVCFWVYMSLPPKSLRFHVFSLKNTAISIILSWWLSFSIRVSLLFSANNEQLVRSSTMEKSKSQMMYIIKNKILALGVWVYFLMLITYTVATGMTQVYDFERLHSN